VGSMEKLQDIDFVPNPWHSCCCWGNNAHQGGGRFAYQRRTSFPCVFQKCDITTWYEQWLISYSLSSISLVAFYLKQWHKYDAIILMRRAWKVLKLGTFWKLRWS
jgi:hypothetical protein